jgi:hypothetical protein
MRSFDQGDFWVRGIRADVATTPCSMYLCKSSQGGFIGLSTDTIDQQFQAFTDLTSDPNYDPYASLIYSLVYNVTGGYWYTASNFEYTKPVVNPPVFQNFTILPQTFSTMRISNLTDFTVELAASNPLGFRQLFVTGTYGASAQQMAAIYQIANDTVQEITDVPGLKWSVSFQPLPPVITSKAATNGGNSLGLSAADGPIFNVLLTATWDDESDDTRVNAAGKSLFAQAEATAAKLNVTNPYLYLNYAAPWQDPIDGYGAESKAALQTASKKYDPTGVFQKQVPGGFKLFD